ncbi:uncharacterized protein PB18E9.04c-like isoform X2 [Vanessa cardui]|uniref:uncharacterized protein PB18E9.04c-like isoform X2 n=1 Tax=Vanessa cardui TaxID=171605 RepID=UPI001F13156B|nr:uncharacterized protein PB18E9.04c-like isoform X2 [Vanessa cardui]
MCCIHLLNTAMYKHCFLLLLVCCNVLCDDCVVFNFEDDSLDDFTNDFGVCVGRSMWDLRRYDDLPLDAPHENSTIYISPESELSCMSSTTFPITEGGTLDIKLYMEPTANSDQIIILVFQSEPLGVITSYVLSAMDSSLTRGWQVVKLPVGGPSVYDGFITLMGVASKSSVILIDSVRFIAPSLNEELCPIYKEDVEDYTTTKPYETTPVTASTARPETPSDNYPNDTLTSSPKTTTDITTTTSLGTTTVTSPTSPDTSTETTSKTTLDTTTENFPHTTTTNRPDTGTETTSETSLQTTTENDSGTSSTTTNCNLNKTRVRVNVNIKIKSWFIL